MRAIGPRPVSVGAPPASRRSPTRRVGAARARGVNGPQAHAGGGPAVRAGRLLSAFALEYGLLGLATALFAVLAGAISAWYVVTRVMELAFSFQPAVALVGLVLALAVTLGIGLAGTWRILSVKPAGLLKNL